MRRSRLHIVWGLLLLAWSHLPAGAAPPEDDRAEHAFGVHQGARMTLRRQGAFLPEDVTFRLGDLRSVVSIVRVNVPRAEAENAVLVTERRGKLRVAETTVPTADGRIAVLRTTLRTRRPLMQLELTGASEMVLRIAGVTRLIHPEPDGLKAEPLSSIEGARSVRGRIALQDAESGDGLVIAMPTGGHISVRLVGVLAEVTLRGASARSASAILTAFHGDALSAIREAEEPGRPETALDPAVANRAPGFAELFRIPPPGASETEYLLFPNRGRAFRPLLADQREAQIRTGFAMHRGGDVHADLALGGDLGLVRQDYGPEDAVTFSVRTLFTARLNMSTESADLLNTDYQGGFALGRCVGDHSWEVYIYHQSSHLGDETLDFGKRARIDYGRETIRFLYSHDFDKLRIYAGPSFNFTAVDDFIRRKTKAQIGAEYRFEGWGYPMYVATDLQLREQNDWQHSFAVQYGVELGDPTKIDPRPKLFVEYFTGYSNMGQFWNEYENSFMIGLGYEF